MRSKQEILNKTDYMKAYSFNLILTERTNSELEHEGNVGKVDSAFYRNFSWQIMGKKKERQLSNIEAKDVTKAKKQELSLESPHVSNGVSNGRLQAIRPSIEKRYKFAPAKIKKCPNTNELFVKVFDRDVRVSSNAGSEEASVIQSRTDVSGSSPKRFTTTCYFKSRTVPAWYTESLLVYIGSTKRRYDEKVWFKHKLQPYYWSENMTTEVNTPSAKPYISEVVIPRDDSNIHYMSLELQQLAASAS